MNHRPFYHRVKIIPECCGNCLKFRPYPQQHCLCDEGEDSLINWNYKCDRYETTANYQEWREDIKKHTDFDVNNIRLPGMG